MTTTPRIPPPPTEEEMENLKGWSEMFGLVKDALGVGADIFGDTAEDVGAALIKADGYTAGQLNEAVEWMDSHGVKRHVRREPLLGRLATRLRRRN